MIYGHNLLSTKSFPFLLQLIYTFFLCSLVSLFYNDIFRIPFSLLPSHFSHSFTFILSNSVSPHYIDIFTFSFSHTSYSSHTFTFFLCNLLSPLCIDIFTSPFSSSFPYYVQTRHPLFSVHLPIQFGITQRRPGPSFPSSGNEGKSYLCILTCGPALRQPVTVTSPPPTGSLGHVSDPFHKTPPGNQTWINFSFPAFT